MTTRGIRRKRCDVKIAVVGAPGVGKSGKIIEIPGMLSFPFPKIYNKKKMYRKNKEPDGAVFFFSVSTCVMLFMIPCVL